MFSLASASFAAADETAAIATATAPSFDSLDRNADNRLSRSEASYNRLLSGIFANCDTNGDGFVSREEYERAVASSAPGNHPGVASRSETRFDNP
jgi:hypothetical protein